MEESDFWWLTGLVLGLSLAQMLQLHLIRKLRADVDFLTVVSRESLRSDDHV